MHSAPSFKSAIRNDPGVGEAGQQQMANQAQAGFMRDTVGSASAPGTARLLGDRATELTSDPRLELQRGRAGAEIQQQVDPMATLRTAAVERQGGSGRGVGLLRERFNGLGTALGAGYASTRTAANEEQNKMRLGLGESGLKLQGNAGSAYQDLSGNEQSAQQSALRIAEINAERQLNAQNGLAGAASGVLGGLTSAGVNAIGKDGSFSWKDFGKGVAGLGGGLKK